LTVSFHACKDENTEKKSQNSIKQDSLNLKLNIKAYDAVSLNNGADSLTRDWPMYNSLKNEMERMQDYTLQDLMTNIISIESVVDSLQETIPRQVDTLPVQSRVKILDIKAKFMLELSQKQKPKLDKIMKIAEEYPMEFNALNIQLNEVFLELPKFD
jgi:hypothetical protein